ncbi:MAG: ABC transporter permease [Candidatus Cloacimonetes bacterium]|jgi:putative ABC transport system permease protein|nr:ABC transporter permease [Candidatus Cloacimonadota bacterium]MBT4331821.1 ABC transporter permease [Candidatus Cloacimonadota bacterium]
MKFYQFAFKNLIRSKTRTLLTVLSISMTAFILFMVLSLNRGFESSVKEDLVEGIGAHLFIARGGCPMDAASIIAQGGISPMYIPEEVLQKIQDVESIKHIMPFKIFSITTSDGMRTDIFCGVTKEVEQMKGKWKYQKGGWFPNDDSVILGADIAVIEQRKVGDKIYVEHFDKEFEVAGILEYAYNQDDGMFFLPLKTAQKLINREGKLSAIAVSVEDIDNLDFSKMEIKSHLADDYMVLTPEAIGNDVMNFFNSTRTIMFAVLFFTLIVSTVGIANTIITMIYERRKEFAYLKCVGASFHDIYKIILYESLILCKTGIIIGISSGILLSSLFEGYVRKFLLTSYISQTAEIIRPGFDIALITMFIVLVIGLLAATYPAIKISKIMPMEAIRNE